MLLLFAVFIGLSIFGFFIEKSKLGDTRRQS